MGLLHSNRAVVTLALTGVGGLLLLILADRFSRHELIGPGLILFAVGVATAGADAIVRRFTYDRNLETGAFVTFHGPAAALIGLVLVVFAMALAAVGVAFVVGAEEALLDYVTARPGTVLLPVGAMSAASGAARVLGAREWKGSRGRFLASLPDRLGGAFLLMAGIVLGALGAFELLAPAAFDAQLAGLLRQVGLD